MKSRDPAKDYAWFMRQPENIAHYAGKIVLLHHRTVLGSGADYTEAAEDARRRAAAEDRALPPQDEVLMFTVLKPIGFDPDYFGATPVRQQEA
jgi:hypothetical protein